MKYTAMLFKLIILMVLIINGSFFGTAQENNPKRQLVLQGFWWDYWNANYPNDWANYLTELAPRLKELGIDAVWIPPTVKNTGTNSVGYAPFDNYDLGDKYQKNSTGTRVGDKDELLRMIAVMKANGIDVIQDIVLNHVTGAGSASGQGGNDPNAMDDGASNGYKNFRYSCYATPALNETASNYLSRTGRFPKNWENFYPNASNPCCTNPINSPYWGPDVSYESNAFGLSSNALYNPTQGNDYMRTNTRNWLIWYKKQTGWDGVRMDAVKHFPSYLAEDVLWNLQYGSLWANGGPDMFAVGEWVGTASELDTWVNDVQNRAGTFDFALRSAFTGIISGNGNFDLGTVPNYQQNNRDCTVPFVNNHDTYRPQLDASGNYTGWNTGSQLGAQIEPTDGRRSLVYAIALAVDGAPEIYFEDLFNIGYLGNRFNHHPLNSAELPVFNDLENLIWCHQNLRFKDGAYMVPWQAQDALVIERAQKALIAVNDSWTNWQNLVGVQTTFTDGTILVDYSGANGTATSTVYGGGKVNISIPPCDGSALQGRRGYAIWAPQGITSNYNLSAKRITQEWEMANDLGDNHPLSLQQGGALPSNSEDCRVVGRIYAKANEQINLEVFPENPLLPITVLYVDKDCAIIDSISSAGTILDSIVPSYSGWYTIKLKNVTSTQVGQKAWVKVNYLAPDTVDTSVPKNKCACTSTSNLGIEEDVNESLQMYPNPAKTNLYIRFNENTNGEHISFDIFDAQQRSIKNGSFENQDKEEVISVEDLQPGSYIIQFSIQDKSFQKHFIKL
jgi:alpha-amylase